MKVQAMALAGPVPSNQLTEHQCEVSLHWILPVVGIPVAHSELEMPIRSDLCLGLVHNREINYHSINARRWRSLLQKRVTMWGEPSRRLLW